MGEGPPDQNSDQIENQNPEQEKKPEEHMPGRRGNAEEMNTSDTKGTHGNSEANDVVKQPLENTTSTTFKQPKKHEEPDRPKEEVSKLKFYSKKVPITQPNFKKPPKRTNT